MLWADITLIKHLSPTQITCQFNILCITLLDCTTWFQYRLTVSIVLNNVIDFVNFLGKKTKVKGTGTMFMLFPVENHDGRIQWPIIYYQATFPMSKPFRRKW